MPSVATSRSVRSGSVAQPRDDVVGGPGAFDGDEFQPVLQQGGHAVHRRGVVRGEGGRFGPRSGSGPGRNTAPRAGRRSPAPETVAPGLHVGRPVGPAAPCRRALRRRAFRPWGCSSRMCLGEKCGCNSWRIREWSAEFGVEVADRAAEQRRRSAARRVGGVAMGAAQVLVVHQPAHPGVPVTSQASSPTAVRTLWIGPRPADCPAVPATAVGGPDETATGRRGHASRLGRSSRRGKHF